MDELCERCDQPKFRVVDWRRLLVGEESPVVFDLTDADPERLCRKHYGEVASHVAA
jgi:hypothetical protein